MCRYGYARVSSKGQQRDGYGLDVQVAELRAHGCTDVREEVYTGVTVDRPVLNALLAEVVAGDTIVFPRIDRVARSTKEGIEFFEEMEARGVEVEVLGLGVMAGGPMSVAFRTIALVFAQLDHDQIVDRLAAGREQARAERPDYREGRRPKEYDRELFMELLARVNSGGMTATAAAGELGVGRTTWYKLVSRYNNMEKAVGAR